ncbi:hypothetical protein K7472_30885 [Streptomyces sp. PTM05]|uniref:Uncharacterized protein n=1 Tax=Streptantibioticus parmotrematis TaxID=2873249 RepID=A0ABS7R193_9ACTN|nr:hypothetical protein [Streptantibioticus parmotrematis]MBY8889220.1 hypothetical protein [Streptantibioticus parmotrematis]
MDPHGPIARRFPLVARFRPACPPLPARIRALTELADRAVEEDGQGLASTVFNQAALLASDLGLPELARSMCHRHADAYLRACPLTAMSAIRGLEPLVNLARLQIRAGQTDDGRHRLLDLYEAVGAGNTAVFEGITVPPALTTTVEERREVHAWLWRVVLADGTRTLTTTGRWREALAHIEQHRGVGTRMLDGRQVAVVAALTGGDRERAAALLAETAPGEPWEQAVTACLVVLSRRDVPQREDGSAAELVNIFLGREAEPGLTVFDTRLGLTVLDAVGLEHPGARSVAEDLMRRATASLNGYAARDLISHALFAALATDGEARACRDLIRACGLGAELLPDELSSELSTALDRSEAVITQSSAAAA